MNKINKILYLGAILVFSISTPLFAGTNRVTTEDFVYLCNGPSSKVYHRSEGCKGLNRCSTQIAKVSLSTAKSKGRRACRIEY